MKNTATEGIRNELAEILRPRRRMSPSSWAEANRRLKRGTTPSPGRWRNDYLPWLAPILDAYHSTAWAEGLVLKKPAQTAGSEILVTLVGYLMATDPGPMLYVCTTQDIARDFALDRFDHMIESTPELARIFLTGKANRETTFVKPALGGKLILAGAGSPNKLISRPARYVFLDEEDRLPTFPGMGSAREISEKRVAEFGTRVRTGIFSIAHPTTPDKGIAVTYQEQSDRREWHIRCPHCSHEFPPAWDHVSIPDRERPDEARYLCPGCAAEITDAQRWTATRRGRFIATRGEDEPAPRFVGFHLSALCHPRIALAELAGDFCRAQNEAQLRVFFNMRLGEEYQEAAIVITEESIAAKVDARGARRKCPRDTRFITAGFDVQKGETAVVLYVMVIAWTSNGNAVVLDFAKLRGFEAAAKLLRTFEAERGEGLEPLRIQAAAVDYGWKTRDVYSFCRRDYGGIRPIPVKHERRITREDPTRMKGTKDPLHPELGNMTRLELCRDHWLDRFLGRFQDDADPELGGSAILPPWTTPELRYHLRANHQETIVDRHGDERRIWMRVKKMRDDFAQAGVYAEVAAVGIGLDKLFEAVTPAPAHEQRPELRGHVSRVTRKGRQAGYVRGRRGRRDR